MKTDFLKLLWPSQWPACRPPFQADAPGLGRRETLTKSPIKNRDGHRCDRVEAELCTFRDTELWIAAGRGGDGFQAGRPRSRSIPSVRAAVTGRRESDALSAVRTRRAVLNLTGRFTMRGMGGHPQNWFESVAKLTFFLSLAVFGRNACVPAKRRAGSAIHGPLWPDKLRGLNDLIMRGSVSMSVTTRSRQVLDGCKKGFYSFRTGGIARFVLATWALSSAVRAADS